MTKLLAAGAIATILGSSRTSVLTHSMQTQHGFVFILPLAARNKDLGTQFFDVTPAQIVPIRAAAQCLPALLKFRLTDGDIYKEDRDSRSG